MFKTKKLLLGIGIFCLFTIIYILSFRINIFNIHIFFYYGILKLLIISIVLIIFLKIYNNIRKIFDIKDIIIIVSLFILINLLFFCMVPVTLERSISIFMLNDMNNMQGMEKEKIEKEFIDKYVYAYKAFDKRLDEQMATGTISKDDNSNEYYITKKGNVLLNILKIINKIYNVNSVLLIE